MNPSNLCYFNGVLQRYEILTLHVSDLLFQRGYGVFDFFRCRGGSVPWLQDYQDRLFSSLDKAGIEHDLKENQFQNIIQTLQNKNKLENGAFKVIISGGYSENLESVSGPANVVILNVDWKSPPAETFELGVNLISENFVRPNPEIKSLYYLNTLRLQKKLKEYNAVDVLFYRDYISEASRANLFFIKDGQVLTPASDILKGITRKQILSICPEIKVEDIRTERLYDFDEIFMTSSSRDVTPVVSVEGRAIGSGKPGPISREIQATFRARGW